MASVASQLIEKVTAHAQSDSLEDVREIHADGTYFPNNLRILHSHLRHQDVGLSDMGSSANDQSNLTKIPKQGVVATEVLLK